jgi:hypothetical protein
MAREPRARFLITAEGGQYRRELRRTLTDTRRFASSVKRAIGAISATVLVASLTQLTRTAFNNADALQKQADKLGVTARQLAALQLAGRLTGVQNEKLTLGLQRLTRRVAEAAQGTGEAQGALKELGLDAGRLATLPLDEQFSAIATAMAGVTSQSNEIRLGFKLFDSEGVDLIRTLRLGAEQLQKIERDTIAWNAALSEVDSRRIEDAQNEIERARTALSGIGNTLAVAFSAAIGGTAQGFADAAAEAEGFRNQINSAVEAGVVGLNLLANTVRGVELAFLAAKLAALELQRLAPDQSFISTPGSEFTLELEGRPKPQRRDRTQETVEALDETGRKIDEVVAKLKTSKQVLAEFRNTQLQAVLAAKQSIEETSALERLLDPAVVEQNQKRIQEANQLILDASEDLQDELLRQERRAARERVRLNEQAERAIRAQKEQTGQLAVGLLQALGSENRAFQIAAIALEKGLAIQRLLIQNRVAAELAFASQLIPGDPSSLARASAAKAAVLAQGRVGAALLAATGVAQIATLGRGSTGAPLGTPTNPVFTQANFGQQNSGADGTRRVEVVISGAGLIVQDTLIKILKEATDADEIFINAGTRQAQTIRSSNA